MTRKSKEPKRYGYYKEYKAHPCLEVFPLMKRAELKALAESIKRDGLQEPIVLTHDEETIVDGRCRLLACLMAFTDPVYVRLPADYTEGQIIRFIISANLTRQHLSKDQIAAIEE